MGQEEAELPYFDRREHAYGELISSIDWTQKLIEEGVRENDREWLVEDISRFLADKNGLKESAAVEKSKNLLSEGGIKFKKLVEEAEENGYLERFRLQEPWHPKSFHEGEFVSYPYQHSSVVVYRGMRRKFFYRADLQDREDRSTKHPTSIFNHQYLRPGSHITGDETNYIWTTTSLKEAQSYGSIVLEIQVPSEWLIVGAKDTRVTSNLKEMHQEFGSPESFRKYLLDNWSVASTSFRIGKELPVQYIRGGWDTSRDGKPEFYPLYSEDEKDLIDVMREVDGDKIPAEPAISKDWNHSDGVAKKRREVERALQIDYKPVDTDIYEILDKIRDGKQLRYTELYQVVEGVEQANSKIRERLESYRSDGEHHHKRNIQNLLFATSKVIEYLKGEFGMDYQVKEVENGEELLKIINNREEMLRENSDALEQYKKELEKKRQELEELSSRELTNRGSVSEDIRIKPDMTPIKQIIDPLNGIKLSDGFATASGSSGIPGLEWIAEKLNMAESEQQDLEEEIEIENKEVRDIYQKYQEREKVDPEEMEEATQRLKKEVQEAYELSESIIKAEKGELKLEEALDRGENQEVLEEFKSDVREVEDIVERFDQEVDRINKELAVLEKVSGVQNLPSSSVHIMVRNQLNELDEKMEEASSRRQDVDELKRKI